MSNSEEYITAELQQQEFFNSLSSGSYPPRFPSDNPVPGSYLYSMGHRNPQGIAFHPNTDVLWSTEHGTSLEQGWCRDEINLIKPLKNYGWPIIRGSETGSSESINS